MNAAIPANSSHTVRRCLVGFGRLEEVGRGRDCCWRSGIDVGAVVVIGADGW
jgi:hypothetical protein